MKAVAITGGIGSGKSYVCRKFASLGIPVYDSDSRAKALYHEVPGLLDRIEDIFGTRDLKELGRMVYADKAKLSRLESLIHPEVYNDFEKFRKAASNVPFVLFESAIILDRDYPEGIFDKIIFVTAPEELRVERTVLRDSSTPENVRGIIRNQNISEADPRIDFIIDNSPSGEELERQIKNFIETMKTDLAKTLSVSGQPGLYTYLAQSRSGAIVESLIDHKRSQFSLSSKITALEDISIYTDEGEVKLREVFIKLGEYLKGEKAPSSKSAPEVLKDLFAKALPTYDRDRFYVSHMKKVVDWYNCLVEFASLDFVNPDEKEEKAE